MLQSGDYDIDKKLLEARDPGVTVKRRNKRDKLHEDMAWFKNTRYQRGFCELEDDINGKNNVLLFKASLARNSHNYHS